MYSNQSLHKNQSNSNLLRLLTKRKSQNITKTINNDWPGKYTPNFANIHIKNKRKSLKSLTTNNNNNNNTKNNNLIRSQQTQQTMRKKVQSVKLIRNIPIAKMSSISLSIKPSTKNCTIMMMNDTWRTNSTRNNKFYSDTRGAYRSSSKILKIQNNNQQYQQLAAFGNNRVSTALQKSQLRQSSSLHGSHNQTKTTISNKYTIKEQKINPKLQILQQQLSAMQQSKQKVLDKYRVDFNTFNYIDKILDNPEIWMKYVKKKKQNIGELLKISNDQSQCSNNNENSNNKNRNRKSSMFYITMNDEKD